MSYTVNAIYEKIKENNDLSHILSQINDVAIIEYDGKDICGSLAIYKYLEDNNLDNGIIKRVVLFGKKNDILDSNVEKISHLFPTAEVTYNYKSWKTTHIKKLRLHNILVMHMAMRFSFDNLQHIVAYTRKAYYAFFTYNNSSNIFFDNDLVILTKLSLSDLKFEVADTLPEKTVFCQDKEEYIKSCLNNLASKDIFFLCMEEVKHGCEQCYLCDNYGNMHYCPMAQRYIAKCYREGIFVPQNQTIAHQWELMASRQGYKSAIIQVADDFAEGLGCDENIEKAVDIYSEYASKAGNENLAKKIISIADTEQIVNNIAVPYIAMLANVGDEDMVIKLSDSFLNGYYGLPKDMAQQKEWIEQGAENGNPRFMNAMAKMYESNNDWTNAYYWYKKLFDYTNEYSDDYISDEQMDEIELRMLTNGKNNNEIAISGQNYLYGWYGVERNPHFAFRCLKYASDAGIPMAKGLLGQMYYNGIEIVKNEEEGLSLLEEAATKGDLISIEKLKDIEIAEAPDGSDWADFIPGQISEGINNDDAIAYYMKGYYYSIGYCYGEDQEEAFCYMEKAAQKGFPIAQYKLALMYKEKNNNVQYYYWLKLAARNGYYKAEGELGIKRFEISKEREIDLTFKYLKDSFEQGYDDAYWAYAQCLMFGYGTNINKKEAYPLYIRAAENGIVDAQQKLCEDYFKGNEYLSKDYGECAKWGEKAITNGRMSVRFETAFSQSNIGNTERAKELYLELANEGSGAAMNNYACELSDPKEKTIWFQKAADAMDDYGLWNLANYYRKGSGVEKDPLKAFELMSQAANMGHTGAIKDLVHMYINGEGTDIDGNKVVEWLEKLVDKGNDDAILKIADIYRQGILVPKDIEKAIKYYKQEALNGNSSVMVELGRMYEEGIDVEHNLDDAVYWYRKAAMKGNKEAQESLKRLHVNWLDGNGKLVDGSLSEEDDDDNYSIDYFLNDL